jgi:hypothetical protein
VRADGHDLPFMNSAYALLQISYSICRLCEIFCLLSTDEFSSLCYLLTYLLTPWCRTLFEKLIVIQPVKKYPVFFMESEGSLLFSQKPATGSYLEPSIPISLRSGLMLSSYLRLGLPSGLLPSGLPTKTL